MDDANPGPRSALSLAGGVSERDSLPPGDTVLICFSHLRWGFVFQRPQHLLTRAARRYRVLFIEEPVFDEGAAPHYRHHDGDDGVTVVVPVLPCGLDEVGVEAAQRSLFDGLMDSLPPGRRIFWYYTPMALGFSGHWPCDLCVYDCMDELSAFLFAPPQLMQREDELLARADIVFTGGQSLYEAKRDRHADAHAFPSSIDVPHFARARLRASPEPADQAALPHPRIGFVGVIDERMDLELLAATAALRPAWQFVLIGPVVKIDEADLPRAANIHWLGGRSYGELPGYMAGWDAALMPFAINAATRYISPTKTPEFLAAGLPVISTPIIDVVRSYGEAGLVEIAAHPAEIVRKAEAVLARPRGPWLAAVDEALARSSWDKTWEAMRGLMEAKLASRRRQIAAPTARRKRAAHA